MKLFSNVNRQSVRYLKLQIYFDFVEKLFSIDIFDQKSFDRFFMIYRTTKNLQLLKTSGSERINKSCCLFAKKYKLKFYTCKKFMECT